MLKAKIKEDQAKNDEQKNFIEELLRDQDKHSKKGKIATENESEYFLNNINYIPNTYTNTDKSKDNQNGIGILNEYIQPNVISKSRDNFEFLDKSSNFENFEKNSFSYLITHLVNQSKVIESFIN